MHPSGIRTACLFSVGLLAGTTLALDIQTVPVGNPGNAPDTRYNSISVGGVAYAYDIGQYEITAAQYTQFLNAVAKTDTYGLYYTYMDYDAYPAQGGCNIERAGEAGNYTYSVAAEWASRPVNYVSWGDAIRFVNWLANGQPNGDQDDTTTEDGSYRLNGATTSDQLLAVTRRPDATWVIPSEDEWYKAAYHKNNGATGNYWQYPTGTDQNPGNVLVNPDPGNNGNFEVWDGYSWQTTLGSPYYRAPVGSFSNSESPYQTFDQGGNVWEWNEAVLSGSFRGVRGGSFDYYRSGLHAQARYNIGRESVSQQKDLGFRVAFVPEPATASLLLVGVLAFLRRRPRR